MADEIHNLTGNHSMTEQKATNITWHKSLLSKKGSGRASQQEECRHLVYGSVQI